MAEIILKELNNIYDLNVQEDFNSETEPFFRSDDSVKGYRHMQTKEKARVLVDIEQVRAI